MKQVMQKRYLRVVLITAFVLLIPLISMQFSDSVRWTVGDFVIIAILLLAGGAAYELISPKVKDKKTRLFVALALIAALVWLWAELAVGVLTPLGS